MSAAAQAPAKLLESAGLRSKWARQSAESLVAALRIVSDLTAQQVALVVGMLRERVTLRPAASSVETAGQVVSGLTGASKILLDLAATEGTVLARGLKEGVPLSANLGALADLIPMSMGTVIDWNKHFLDAISAQAQDFAESYASGKPLNPGGRVAGLATNWLQSMIETQQKLLDQVADQVTIATGTHKEAAEGPDRTKVLTAMARQGIGRFIDAQKQILDLAIEQVEEIRDRPRPKASPRMSMAELTRKSVRNITTAQKSLLDLAKPAAAAPAAASRKAQPAAARRPRTRKRAATAATKG